MRLSTVLRGVLRMAERTGIPVGVVTNIIYGSLTFILQTKRTLDLDTIRGPLSTARTGADENAENTAQVLYISTVTSRIPRDYSAIRSERVISGNTTREARVVANKYVEVEKKSLQMGRETSNEKRQESGSRLLSYVAAATRGGPLAGEYNVQSPKRPSAQTQCEVAVHFGGSLFIQRLRAINLRNLKFWVQPAIGKSDINHIASMNIVSSDQLKDRELKIETKS